MSETKGVEVKYSELQEGQVVWSEYFKCYEEYTGQDTDSDYCFKFLFV